MKKLISVLIFFAIMQQGLSQEFRYNFVKGTKFRIVSNVIEDIYINNTFSQRNQILGKVAISVEDVKDGRGFYKGVFQNSTVYEGVFDVFQLDEERESAFWIDAKGRYDIDDSYYMPVVRSVPTFPEGIIKPGDTWQAPGEEVHDISRGFEIFEPVRFPVLVNYEYIGKEVYEGKVCDAFKIQYSFMETIHLKKKYELYPVRIIGKSIQKMYWDGDHGRPHAYEEEFDFLMILNTGVTIEYIGKASAHVIQAEDIDKKAIVDSINKDLKTDGITDLKAQVTDKGVMITLENIKFDPESSVLQLDEKIKLNRIAKILAKYPGHDVLVTGHTAWWGTEDSMQELSEKRAAIVAQYLLDLGVRMRDEIYIEGKGGKVPVANNNTEAGMSKNRRVEITILEN